MSTMMLPSEFDQNEALELRKDLFPQLLDVIKRVEPSEKGFVLVLGSQSDDLLLATSWLRLERVCNPFLRMNLNLEAQEGPIRLELSGPKGTEDFLLKDYALKRWL